MMRKLLIWVLCGLCGAVYAQDPQFSQIYSNPFYMNPALVGNTIQERVVLNYRNQWPGVGKSFITYAASYDHYAKKYNSGFGANIVHDQAGTHALKFTAISGGYAYNIQLARLHALRLGVQFGYTLRYYDPSKLFFADQVARDNAPGTIETNLATNSRYLDISTGALYYSVNYWGGIAIKHINQPNQAFIVDGVERLPAKFSIHGGGRVPIKKTAKKQMLTSLSLAFNYKAERKWDQLDLGGYIEHSDISIGMWYRGLPLIKDYRPGLLNHDALVFLVGYDFKKYGTRIGYSYDVTLSRLALHSAGSHELSLIVEWPIERRRRKRSFVVPCAKF